MSTHAAQIRRRIESVSLRPDGNAAARMLRRAAGNCVVAGLLLWMMVSSAFAAVEPHDIEERVRCQIAIEDIGWSHRLWPEHNTIAKPARSAVLSNADIRAKVETSLRMESALSARYGIQVGTRMLQLELNRIARSTRAPARLRELFVALGNDPHAVAECIARPLLVARLLRDAYANDDAMHAEARSAARSVLPKPGDPIALRESGARVSETVYEVGVTDEPGAQVAGGVGELDDANATVRLTPESFEALRSRLHVSVSPAVDGVTPLEAGEHPELRLQETETGFVLEHVLSESDERVEVRTAVWEKRSFEDWWAAETHPFSAKGSRSKVDDLVMPEVVKTKTSTPMAQADSWRLEQFPDPRSLHTAVWTGSEMIVWGGWLSNYHHVQTGGRYDPVTDTWVPTNTDGAPSSRRAHIAVWTGSEMIVWGGYDQVSRQRSGGRYNPLDDTWTATSLVNAPTARFSHTAVWNGTSMMIWGGSESNGPNAAGGGVYVPAKDLWIPMSSENAPPASREHVAVWTGEKMMVWGGRGDNGILNSGGSYDPAANQWVVSSTVNSPEPRFEHSAVWTGEELIVWGGRNTSITHRSGGRYNPATDTWGTTSAVGAPSARARHSAVWDGSEMIVWGGSTANGDTSSGAHYDPNTDIWTPAGAVGGPAVRAGHTAIWTGTEMIVWGGEGTRSGLSAGGKYEPHDRTWSRTYAPPSLSPRSLHTAVWTGSEMIIWGGWSPETTPLGDGSRYDPTTDSFTPVAMQGAPMPRRSHGAVWTGSEMIVWGGASGSWMLDSGGRYNPQTDSWVATTLAGRPSGRTGFSTIWTGDEMVVWGGNAGGRVNTGGRYDPTTDSWSATTTIAAPAGRTNAISVWTGTDLLIWGGLGDTQLLTTGGRYDPEENLWTPMSTADAPTPRDGAAAVWTGDAMIVWGGTGQAGRLGTGSAYDPASDSWLDIEPVGAPSPRYGHTAIWTGREMVIWSGNSPDNAATGGQYDPLSNAWRPVSLENAPGAKLDSSAVWTGTEMIVWGSVDGIGVYYPYATTATLNYTAGPNGTIAGSATQTVAIGDDGDPVTAVPAATYRFVQWSDGRTDNPRQDLDVTTDIDVQASFALLEYTVSASAVGEGSITPAQQAVAHGGAATFTVAPAANHHVAAVTGNTCTPVNAGDGTWIANTITGECAVVATFAIDTFAVTMEEGANGSLAPLPGQPFPLAAVPYGSQVAFDLTPDAGHRIHSAGGCGGSLEGGRYTTAPITASCTVWARFNRNPVAIDAERTLREDQNVSGHLLANDDDPLVFTLVSNGTLGTATITNAATGEYTYVPSPDIHGSDHFTFQVSDGGAQSNVATVSVSITAVNDRPQFEPDALPSHAAGESGVQSIPNFGSFIAGPPDEQGKQSVDGFIIDSVDDGDGVLQPGSVSIDPVQTLRYTLTGTGGTAQITVRVRDTGGTANGGVDISLPRTFVIAVAASADLQVAKSIVGGAPSGNDVIYAITVTNAGPNAAEGATLADPVPPGLIDAEWACNPGVSTAPCPNPSAGTGDMQVSLALPVGTFLRFDFTARIDAPPDTTITNTASVTAPAAVADLLPDNNIASATFVHGGDRIFGNGFETGGEVLTVPAAAQAHRAASQ